VTGAVNVNQQWARALLEELSRGGVRHGVVCPGSRSTPLALACAERADLRIWSVIDERSAAFFALGIAKETGQPVVLVATSGTAGANFFPAVIEASMSHVPLIVLTADRPLELQGWGAPQTMPQQHLYGSFSRWFADLGLPEASPSPLLHLRATAARAVATATRAPRGPVQLNVPFREPLAPVPDGAPLEALPPLAAQGRGELPFTRIVPPEREPDRPTLRALRQRLAASEKGVIVCGPRDAQDGLAEAVVRLGQAYGYPIFAEATSQVRYGQAGVLSLYDGLLRNAAFARAHCPAIVLRLGGGLTPKGPQAWLDASGAYTVQFSDEGSLVDPQHSASLVIEGDPVRACDFLYVDVTPRTSAWSQDFAQAEAQACAALESAFAQDPSLDEPRIAHEVVAALPAGTRLFVSSSMPIRAVDAFAPRGAAVRVLANRGVNGIDGIVSSALGVAAGAQAPTVLLTGDLAFLHDLGGLLTAHREKLSLTVVVIQNDGGGIFSFLPIAQHTPHFEALFGTPHGLASLEPAAALFQAHYAAPRTVSELKHALGQGLRGGLHLLEVRVDRQSNPEHHRTLLSQISQASGEGPWP